MTRGRFGFTFLLAGAIVAGGAILAADPRHTSVRVGRPNVWTLEQAHYLLAKQREENATLASKKPSQDDLNPNAIHGSRLDILRSALGIGVEFDQTVGTANRTAVSRVREETQRRQTLNARIDTYGDESVVLAREISVLTIEKAQLDPEKEKEAVAAKQAMIAAKTAEKAAVDAEIQRLQTQVTALTANLEKLASIEPQLTTTLPGVSMKDLLDEVKSMGDPKLHASVALDNFVQMQYELIAKQLSLIRDDLDASQRLVFVELPISIYSVPKKSDDDLVQVWWRINGHETCVSGCASEAEAPDRFKMSSTPTLPAWVSQRPSLLPNTDQAGTSKCSEEMPGKRVTAPGKPEPHYPLEVVDLVPRQSALNVNDSQQRSRGLNLSGVFSWLTGLGIKTTFERQRETFQQFVTQDSFASGFGKGTDTFGWTFGPLPGTGRIAPGLRTTYAAIVLPKDAVGLRLGAVSCVIDRKRPAPTSYAEALTDTARCNAAPEITELFDHAGEGFWVNAARYTPVRTGEVATLLLMGHFSPQVSVLVNGRGLTRELNLGESTVGATQLSGDGIDGAFEFVNQNQLILRIRGSAGADAQPRIALVTPQKTREIGQYVLTANGICQTLNVAFQSEPIFVRGLSLTALQAVGVQVGTGPVGSITIQLTGSGIRSSDVLTVNAQAVSFTPISSTAALFTMPIATQAHWTLLLRRADGSDAVGLTVANPLMFKQGAATIAAAGAKTSTQPDRYVVTVSLDAGSFDASLDVVDVRGAKKFGSDKFAATTAVIGIESPEDEFSVVISRRGTPFAQTWTVQKPRTKSSHP